MGILEAEMPALADLVDELKDEITLLKQLKTIFNANTLLRHPMYIVTTAVDVPASSTLQNPKTILDTAIAGSYGARLASVSIAVDAVFQANYYWKLVVDGVTSPTQPFIPFDPTVNTFDLIPSGTFYLLKPGAGIHFYAYNATGTTNDGHASIYVSADLIDNQNEYNILQGLI